MSQKEVAVMVNGLPGKMASKVCEHIMNVDKEIYPFYLYGSSLTGPEIEQKHFDLKGSRFVLFRPHERNELLKTMTWHHKYTFVAVDFSQPSAVLANSQLYCAHKIPFVMGTTGNQEDFLAVRKIVADSGNCAVIAPNMAKQIVAFQAAMEFVANNFPNVFRGYSLEITESHQKGKADTSGTAKAMVEYFNKMGIPFSKDQIVMIRDPELQKEIGIPKEHLSGHGWHTYTLRSADKTILFHFVHNVNGRDIYAAGTLDAISFLARNIQTGKVYSMLDVLGEEG